MSFIMWGGHVVDTLRGYLVETIVYLYLLSIIPLHENPLKPVREPIHEPALHFKPIWEVLQSPISSLHAVLDELRDVARDPSGQLKMLLEAAREEKSPVKPLADALENAVEEYEQRQKEADLEIEIAWRELIETSEHYVH